MPAFAESNPPPPGPRQFYKARLAGIEAALNKATDDPESVVELRLEEGESYKVLKTRLSKVILEIGWKGTKSFNKKERSILLKADLPDCLEHPKTKVRRYGTYGTSKRQRFWCAGDGGHTFTETLPRQDPSILLQPKDVQTQCRCLERIA